MLYRNTTSRYPMDNDTRTLQQFSQLSDSPNVTKPVLVFERHKSLRCPISRCLAGVSILCGNGTVCYHRTLCPWELNGLGIDDLSRISFASFSAIPVLRNRLGSDDADDAGAETKLHLRQLTSPCWPAFELQIPVFSRLIQRANIGQAIGI